MSSAKRNLVTIDDLSNQEIEALFSLAEEMADSIDKQSNLCQHKIMASLFFEPSTRTRLSFETAMHRLGGSVISATEIGATSLSKGESIADMARIVGSYADIVVIRHPWEGAAKVVADYADVPVINAGDGSHEHPTQTLCDLYTLAKEKKTIEGLKIAIWGDLKYGRTVHSLIYALARLGATILFRSGPGLELPEHVITKLSTEYKGKLQRLEKLGESAKEKIFPLDAVYVTPTRPHQLTMIPDTNIRLELEKGIDAIYVTRLQKERLAPIEGEENLERHYPIVNRKLLKRKELDKTLIMHPLPRILELTYDVDADPRSMYFKQAARGVPVRMALIAFLLGVKKLSVPEGEEAPFTRITDYPIYNRCFGVKCHNPNCVSVQETEKRYIVPEFKITATRPLTLRCVYCDHESHPPYIASTQGDKRYHSAHSLVLREIKPEHLIIFDSEEEARQRGFSPSQYAHTHVKGGHN